MVEYEEGPLPEKESKDYTDMVNSLVYATSEDMPMWCLDQVLIDAKDPKQFEAGVDATVLLKEIVGDWAQRD